ncbi:MAG: rhomboid family intramembrane serine protease [Acidobacteria bacterium]|nr:rhomboid family intramembrane serine protease [Acidobacteriota bacterium]
MAYRDYYGTGGRGYTYSVGSSNLPPAVKWLLIVNVALFLGYFFATQAGSGWLFDWMGLMPSQVVYRFKVWQLATYLFLHSATALTHILLNMLTLWMIGKDLENVWGTKRFLQYYLICGVGAGVFVVLLNLLFGSELDMVTRTIGASGAIYGLLLAFGILFPDATLFFWIFPMKAKYCVALIGAIAFLMTFGSTGGGISHTAHLGGMVWGLIYLRSRGLQRAAGSFDPIGWANRIYREWKHERAKKKFQVYMRKQRGDSGRGPWVQ